MRPLSTEISLVIPIYQPEKGWEDVLMERYDDFCNEIGADIPLILVNDGSPTDISGEVNRIKEKLGLKASYLSYPINRGKGGALKTASATTTTPYIMFTDIDLPYETVSMIDVYKAILQNGGIVAGFRQDKYYNDVSNFRTWLSKSLRKLNKIILGLPINDTQCGLKAYDQIGKDILLTCKTERFLIDLEFLLAANAKGLKITPVDVELRPDIVFTKFNPMVLMKEVVNFLELIWKYRIVND